MSQSVVFLLDVKDSLWTGSVAGSSDESAKRNNLSPLDKAIHAITQMIHQKIIDAKKTDQISLILFNTDETNNHMSDHGQFKHISIAQSLAAPCAGTILYLREKLTRPSSSSSADLLDALIVAADHLITITGSKKTMERRIFLLADASVAMNFDGVAEVLTQFRKYSIRIDCISLTDPEIINPNVKDIIIDQVEGGIYSIEEALSMLSEFMTKRIRQVATYRGDLSVADSLKIPIQLYTKSSWQRLPSAHKHCPDGEVQRNLYYAEANSEDTSEAASSRKNLIKAYRYGRSLIPFHKLDESEMALKTEKSLYLLGFLPANQIPREAFMSGTYAIVAEGGNAKAQQALSAFIRGLYEKDAVGLARYVRAEGGAPKLGVLIPRIKAAYESLLFIALPFAEDYRRYLFAPFLEKVQLSAEQTTVMNEWLTAMNLMTAARDEEDQPMEALRPGDTHNILFAHHYAAVQKRVLKPDELLPEADPSLLAHLSTPEEVLTAARPLLERLKVLFPLRRQPQKQAQLQSIPRLWSAEVGIEAMEVIKEKDTDAEPNKPPQSIDPENPLPDFQAMINAKHQDLVQPALMQLMALIPKYVAAGRYELAFQCFLELREASVREDEFDLFNTFMKEYRRQAASHSLQLWNQLKEAQITLISLLENAESPITPEQAKEFFDIDFNNLDHQE